MALDEPLRVGPLAERHTLRRLLLLTSCILGVFQYGMVLTNGVIAEDFNVYYGLTEKEGDTLYAFMNFGACALSFLPGLCYDRVGCVWSMVLGTLVFNCGMGLQLVWTPDFPDWLSTMAGLEFCYLCFGFASSFFNVLGSFAPLQAFPPEQLGKVSAVVQVCLSLGITVQTQAYRLLQQWVGADGDFVGAYLWYSLAFTNCAGVLMCWAFASGRKVLQAAAREDAPAAPLSATLLSRRFAYYALVFFVAVGFSFSFLDVEPRLAAAAGVSADALGSTFGVLNALGRLCVSLPLDYTRHHRFGGVWTYLAAALACFTCGLLCLGLPAEATASHVYAANALVSFGYGGMLGIVPPALTLHFGTQHLGAVYGLLYAGVAISEPLWTALLAADGSCVGVSCYRPYCLAGASGIGVTCLLTLLQLRRELRTETVSECR